MKRSRVRLLLVVSALVCSLAACGGKDDAGDDLPTLTPGSSTSAPSTPAASTPPPSATPSAEPTRSVTKYGELTLVFNQPAKIDTKAKSAMTSYRVFQQTFREMLGTDRNNPVITTVAGPTVVTYVKKVLQNQVKDGDRLGGTLTVTATVEEVGQASVLIGGCFDQSKTYGIRPDGKHYTPAVVKQQPRLEVGAIASPSSGGWRITDYRLENNPC